MEGKKIIVFIVHTEYHFIQSINIAMSSFNDNVYKNYIFVYEQNERTQYVIDPNLENNIFIKFHTGVLPSDIVNEIIDLNSCYRFFFFQENSIYNRFLAYTLKKNLKTIICLGQDGYKPYAVFNKKHELLSMLKDTFQDNIELWKNGLRTLKFLKSEYYRYGSSSYIDELWLTNKESFDSKRNKTKAELKEIPPFSLESISSIKLYFKDLPNSLEGKTNVIMYLNQPFWTKDLIRKEMEFLNNLNNHFKRKVYLKLHPGTSKETIEKYKKIANLEIIDSKLPAELMILDIKKSIIFSGWSTALITYNSSCNYYFNFPIYKNCGAKAVDQSELTILDHIEVIESPEQMKFPNE